MRSWASTTRWHTKSAANITFRTAVPTPILLPHVIRYNGTRPQKTATWPKYNYYKADLKYQEIARTLGLPCATPAEA